MNRYKLTSTLILGCLITSVATVSAQQLEPGKNRPPRLTSDDVARSRNAGTVVVLNAFNPEIWTKHNPAGLRLTVELPGGIDPREVDLPHYAVNVPYKDYLDARLYVGMSTSLQVNLLLIPSQKITIGEADIRKEASAFVKAFSTKIDPRATYSAVLTNKSTASLKASMIGDGGAPYELIGSLQAKGMEMWLVASIYRQTDERARGAARRITQSAKLN